MSENGRQVVQAEPSGYPMAIYILYLASFVTGITWLIGGVMAILGRNEAPAWQASHLRFQVRTFWPPVRDHLRGDGASAGARHPARRTHDHLDHRALHQGHPLAAAGRVGARSGLLGVRREEPLSLGQEAAVAQVLGLLEAKGIRAVHIGIFDIDARFRVKRVETEKFVKLLKGGYEFCEVLYHWDVAEVPYRQGAWADAPAPIDPTSGRLYPFADGEALFIAEFAGETGRLAPRNLLKDQLARAGAMGFQVTAGFEYEFFLLRETPASVRVKDYTGLESWQPGNHTYSMVPSIEHDFFDGLETVLELLGIGIDSIHTEQGPGCVEMPLKPAPGLIAADNAALFKTFTKAHCERQGLMATFMAKWSNQTNGQSGHLHVSLQDDDGNALFHDPADPQGISATMRHFVGGLVTLLPETLAMCSHTVNAYRRMVPGIWAPVVSAWGVQNRCG